MNTKYTPAVYVERVRLLSRVQLVPCAHCDTLHRPALNSDLCGGCYERGVLTHRPAFGRGGKLLEPGSATPSGLRAAVLFILLLGILGVFGRQRFNRGERAASFIPRSRQAEPYVAEPARASVVKSKAKPAHVQPKRGLRRGVEHAK